MAVEIERPRGLATTLRQHNNTGIQSLALFEGILGWVTAWGEYIQHIDEYVPEAWDPTDAAIIPSIDLIGQRDL